MNLKILKTTDPRLRKKSIRVRKIDKKIKSLVSDLKDTLAGQKDPEGVGLAAPQVGKNIQLFLIEHEGESRVVINPKILELAKISKKNKKESKKDRQILEGCLSLPHYYGHLVRSSRIKIEYTNENGIKKVEEFKGFMAQIVQHELDHLEGILFIDHIIQQKKPLYKYVRGEWEEVELI